MPTYLLTLVWNDNKASNAVRIAEFEAFKKKSEVKGTITDWVVEYQPVSNHAHVHCIYTTGYTNSDTIKYSFKKKFLHIDVRQVKEGTLEYVKGYLHKPATKEPVSNELVVKRQSLPQPSEDLDEIPFNPTPEWRQEQIQFLKKKIMPVPLYLMELY